MTADNESRVEPGTGPVTGVNGLASSVPAVRVEGVVKRFGATVALDGAGLEVPGGMVFGLLGPNGAGKTTLVRILATLLAPDAGRAEGFGHDGAGEPGAVRELRREGTTLLLTTQYLEEADQLADRIAVIDRGKVIAEGTGNELKDRVGGQILEVELSSVGQRDRAQAVLAGVGCGEPQPDERPDRLTLPAPRNGLQLGEGAAAGLRRAPNGVNDIGLRRPTPGRAFLALPGAPPSQNGDGPSPRPRRRPRPHPPTPAVPPPPSPLLRRRLLS